MKAMHLTHTASLLETDDPLELVDLPVPEPGLGEVRIRVRACGVCHTELDEIEGRTPPPHFPIVPGHEVVGVVEALGEGCERLSVGDRVGVGWIHSSDGTENENLSEQFVATGRDRDGGYAQRMVAREEYAFPVPSDFSDVEAAPLLCAGAIGYRALKLCHLRDGQSLGLTGFGGSGHLVLQLARFLYPHSDVCVFARDAEARELARSLGATWTGSSHERAPHRLDAIIDTTPAWAPVVEALANLRPGGRLVINAIRKEDADQSRLLGLRYEQHLWMEKEIKSVANITAADIAEFLPLAAQIPLRPEVEVIPLEDANRALVELKRQSVRGAKVLTVD